ncbi:Ubiquitin fusion degradation protein UFD1 domain containing protein [Elaphomyces granulatus]
MALDTNVLRWSSQLTVTPPVRTPRLSGDKILLPQSALEQLLAAAPVADEITDLNPRIHTSTFDPFNPYTFAAEARARARAQDASHQQLQQLPHPLTFRIVNPQNGRVVHAGIREFSAKESEVGLSSFLRTALDLKDSDFHDDDDGMWGMEGEGGDGDGDKLPVVTVHAKQLPKGAYVRLRPLEAGYDPEDWKALLERHLRDNFTTLTTGEILTITGGRHEDFRFLVDKVLPDGDGICIVDTDLEVDIEPLNEEQARETLKRRLEKTSRAPGTKEGSSPGGPIALDRSIVGQVRIGEYVDYELCEWDHTQTIDIELDIADGADIDLFVSPLSPQQRARPRGDEHVFGEFSARSSKRITLRPTNTVLGQAEALYISVHASAGYCPSSSDEESQPLQSSPLQYSLCARTFTPSEATETIDSHEEEAQCKNCQQWVPKRTLFLHENFCLRNNVLCPQCKNVFQKKSKEWQSHWHCEDDSVTGNDMSSRMKHDIVCHTPHFCTICLFEAQSLPGLAYHRTTTCPGKLILCQFCHLLVPQQGDSDPDVLDPEVLLSGLTPHEFNDGGRTTECHLCNKIVRLRDIKTHQRHHDLERLSRPAPRVCINPNCGRVLDASRGRATNYSLGLCSICFGPLYADTHDPEGKALRRRVERRYLSQMMTGCGKPWCRNRYCKTGRQQSTDSPVSMTSKDILNTVKPLVDAVGVDSRATNTAPLYLCTDETSQRRRILAEMIAAEGVYEIKWCVAALDGSAGDLDKARDWLTNWAPKNGEIVKT